MPYKTSYREGDLNRQKAQAARYSVSNIVSHRRHDFCDEGAAAGFVIQQKFTRQSPCRRTYCNIRFGILTQPRTYVSDDVQLVFKWIATAETEISVTGDVMNEAWRNTDMLGTKGRVRRIYGKTGVDS